MSGSLLTITIDMPDPPAGTIDGLEQLLYFKSSATRDGLKAMAEGLRQSFVDFSWDVAHALARGERTDPSNGSPVFESLYDVAERGYELFQHFFAFIEDPEDSKVIGYYDWLAQRLSGSCRKTIMFGTEFVFLPWQLMYLGPPDQNNIDISRFLGYRHSILTQYIRGNPFGEDRVNPDRFLLAHGVSSSMEQEVRLIEAMGREAGHRVHTYPRCDAPPKTMNDAAREFIGYWNELKPHLFHAGCHGSHDRLRVVKDPTSPSGFDIDTTEPHLEIAQTFQVRRTNLRSLTLPARKECVFGFLNACSTNRSFVTCEGGMGADLLRLAADCVISTECDVEVKFGGSFAEAFYRAFLTDGLPVVRSFLLAQEKARAGAGAEALRGLAYTILVRHLDGSGLEPGPTIKAA